MYKSLSDIDPNEIVTKSYLKDQLQLHFSKFEQSMDKKINEQTQNFERYIGMLAEEFQSRLGTVTEMVLEDRGKVLEHDYLLKKLLAKRT